MKQVFVIVCESAVIEKDTNKLYLFGIFDNISTSSLPALQPTLAVVTRFEERPGRHNHKIIIRHNESGQQIATLEGQIEFGGNERAQYIGKFIGLPLPSLGKYIVEIHIDNILQPIKGSFNVK